MTFTLTNAPILRNEQGKNTLKKLTTISAFVLMFLVGALVSFGHTPAQAGSMTEANPITNCPTGQYWDLFKEKCETFTNGEPTDVPTEACVSDCITSSTTSGLVNPITFGKCSASCTGHDKTQVGMQNPCPGTQYLDLFTGTCKSTNNGQPSDQPTAVCVANCAANSRMAGVLTNPVSFGICTAKC